MGSMSVSFIMSNTMVVSQQEFGQLEGQSTGTWQPPAFHFLVIVTSDGLWLRTRTAGAGQGNIQQLRFRKSNMPRGLVWERTGTGIQSLAWGQGRGGNKQLPQRLWREKQIEIAKEAIG